MDRKQCVFFSMADKSPRSDAFIMYNFICECPEANNGRTQRVSMTFIFVVTGESAVKSQVSTRIISCTLCPAFHCKCFFMGFLCFSVLFSDWWWHMIMMMMTTICCGVYIPLQTRTPSILTFAPNLQLKWRPWSCIDSIDYWQLCDLYRQLSCQCNRRRRYHSALPDYYFRRERGLVAT